MRSQILRAKRIIKDHEFNLLVRGPGAVDRASQPANPQPTRLSEGQWDLLTAAEAKIFYPPAEEGGT
jgi:hypothetical protein